MVTGCPPNPHFSIDMGSKEEGFNRQFMNFNIRFSNSVKPDVAVMIVPPNAVEDNNQFNAYVLTERTERNGLNGWIAEASRNYYLVNEMPMETDSIFIPDETVNQLPMSNYVVEPENIDEKDFEMAWKSLHRGSSSQSLKILAAKEYAMAARATEVSMESALRTAERAKGLARRARAMEFIEAGRKG